MTLPGVVVLGRAGMEGVECISNTIPPIITATGTPSSSSSLLILPLLSYPILQFTNINYYYLLQEKGFQAHNHLRLPDFRLIMRLLFSQMNPKPTPGVGVPCFI